MHFLSGGGSVCSSGKRRHDFITDGFDDDALVLCGYVSHARNTGSDEVLGRDVAQRFVKMGAFRNICKQNCKGSRFVKHSHLVGY